MQVAFLFSPSKVIIHGHAMTMAKKQKKTIFAQTKAQARLLLFWVGCVCPMGVLYEPTDALCL
jgi:hypothetical protein